MLSALRLDLLGVRIVPRLGLVAAVILFCIGGTLFLALMPVQAIPSVVEKTMNICLQSQNLNAKQIVSLLGLPDEVESYGLGESTVVYYTYNRYQFSISFGPKGRFRSFIFLR